MCWQQDPKERPTFAEAMKLLTGNEKTSTTFFDEAIKQRQNDLERERLKEEQRKLEEDMKRFELDLLLKWTIIISKCPVQRSESSPTE